MFDGHAHGRAGNVHFRKPKVSVAENLCFGRESDVADFLFMGDAAECAVVLKVQLKPYLLRRDMGFVVVFAISRLEEELEGVAGFPSVVIVVGCVIADNGIPHGGAGLEMTVDKSQAGDGWFGGSCPGQIVDEEERRSERVLGGWRDGRLREGLDEFVEWHGSDEER